MNTNPDFVLPRAGIAPSLKSGIAQQLARSTSPIRRLRSGRVLRLFYEVGDPHSQLAADAARAFLKRLRVPLQVLLVPPPPTECYPEEALQRRFAATDASRLAPCYGLQKPIALDTVQARSMTAHLAQTENVEKFLDLEQACLQAVTRGGPFPGAGATPSHVERRLAEGAKARRELGHYLPAMWQYRGEWFWALDRLEFLEDRLRADDALDGNEPLLRMDHQQLPNPPTPGDPLEFWFSFRSPYSYLAAIELFRHADRYPTFKVRPVLPMVMRGLPVPRDKRLYIVRDTYRRAMRLGIPFGRLHDPVGDGVLRLLTVYPREATAMEQLRFCAVAGQSVWAEGLDCVRDDVLRSIVERSGQSWSVAQARLARGYDTGFAEDNRKALSEAGLWGVPSFRRGAFITWGQDRMWMLQAP